MNFGPWVLQLLLNYLLPFCSRKRCVIHAWIECKKGSLAGIGLRVLFLLWFKHAIQFWNNDNSKAAETVHDGASELPVCSRAEIGNAAATRGVAAVFAGKWAAALWHPSEEVWEQWVVPYRHREGGCRKSSSSVCLLAVTTLCSTCAEADSKTKPGPQGQGRKAKTLNLSCGGADFDLSLWEGKGLQSTAVRGDSLVPLLWKAAGSCLKWNGWWGSAKPCVCSGLCLRRGLSPRSLLCVSLDKVQCVLHSPALGLWDTPALNCGLGKWQGQVHISGLITCLPLS